MALTSNIQAFYNLTQPHPLFNSYRFLVALELALKDANCIVLGGGGHDVPNMLVAAANLPSAIALPHVSAQINSYSVNLRRDLSSITCQGKNNSPQPVPPTSYPYIRYSRCVGDWGGVNETPPQNLITLENTCRLICAFMTAHGAQIGVYI